MNLLSVRFREAADTAVLNDILARVHNLTGYPVDGPSVFDTFLAPPAGEVARCIVATIKSTDEGTNDQVVGSATLMHPTEDLYNFASRIYVTEHDGTLDNHAILSRFFVDPASQAKGAGRAMLQDCLSWGREERKRIVLVVLEKDLVARRLYEREGFTGCGETVFTSKWGVKHRCFGYLGPTLEERYDDVDTWGAATR